MSFIGGYMEPYILEPFEPKFQACAHCMELMLEKDIVELEDGDQVCSGCAPETYNEDKEEELNDYK